MDLLIYTCEDAPPALRYEARFFSNGELTPAYVSGPDKEALKVRAQAWWDAEIARVSKPDGRGQWRKQHAERAAAEAAAALAAAE